MLPSNYARHRDLVRQRTRNCHGDEMKHLDVVDGVIGATSLEARPPSGVIGDNIELLILHLRMPDAETWIAHTATHAVIRIEEQQILGLSPHIQWTHAQDPLRFLDQRRDGRPP